jgi:hypothetical protein
MEPGGSSPRSHKPCILIHALIKQNKILIYFGYSMTEKRYIMLRNSEISSQKLIKIYLSMIDVL